MRGQGRYHRFNIASSEYKATGRHRTRLKQSVIKNGSNSVTIILLRSYITQPGSIGMAPGITGQLVTAWIIILLQVSRRVMTRVASQQQRYTTADHSSCSNNQQQQHNNTLPWVMQRCTAPLDSTIPRPSLRWLWLWRSFVPPLCNGTIVIYRKN